MRRLTAITLLIIVVFNLYGYRVVMACLQQQSSYQVEHKIDRNEFSDAELISLKTTLNLPYYTSSPEFERAYGSIRIGGVDYEYVKRRVYNDTLEVLCLPNHKKTALTEASNEITRSSADGASAPIKKTAVLKIVLPDYCQSFAEEQAEPAKAVVNDFRLSSTHFISSDYSLAQEKPPQGNA